MVTTYKAKAWQSVATCGALWQWGLYRLYSSLVASQHGPFVDSTSSDLWQIPFQTTGPVQEFQLYMENKMLQVACISP